MKCSYPQVTCVVFTTASYKIGTEAIRIFRIVPEILDTSVSSYTVRVLSSQLPIHKSLAEFS